MRSKQCFLVSLQCVFVAVGVFDLLSSRAPGQSSTFRPDRAGYYDTVWPSEHTDLWRTHAVPGAGLPAGFDPGQLAVSTVGLNLPQWGYTRDRDEIFIAGGSPVGLDTFTQSYKIGAPLTEEEVAASIARDLLNPSVAYVAKINPIGMQNQGQVFLNQGQTVNYNGGLLMHQNGYVYAVAQSVLYKIDPSMNSVRSVPLPLVGDNPEEHFWTTYNGMQVLASGRIVLKGIHLLDGDIPGWLLQVEPDDLSIPVQDSSRHVGTARMTIDQTEDGRAWLYHSTYTDSLRFEITDTGFDLDHDWTRTYRMDGDGTTQASSPVFFGEIGQVVFADNTEQDPSTMEPSTPFHLYSQSVDTAAVPPGQLARTPAFRTTEAGFNFYMVAGDPFETQAVVYYDPINNFISAHLVGEDGTLTELWEDPGYKSSASPAIAPDRDLLYMDDYNEVTGHDEFVVLQLSTGDELARIPLDATLPTIGTIFLGMNNDVYISSTETGGTNGLVSRIYLVPEPSSVLLLVSGLLLAGTCRRVHRAKFPNA